MYLHVFEYLNVLFYVPLFAEYYETCAYMHNAICLSIFILYYFERVLLH